ncbi:hypothetical protein, partial [Mycoplasmoides pirum]|uniref:hypothetical protein n=2 Tax=Mycoplasmoides pirum TaxID=2122 RepID=UPI00138AFD20
MKKKKILKKNFIFFGLSLGLIIPSVISITILNKNNFVLKNQNQLITNSYIRLAKNDVTNFVYNKFAEVQEQINLDNYKTYPIDARESLREYLESFFSKNGYEITRSKMFTDNGNGLLTYLFTYSKNQTTISESYVFENFRKTESFVEIQNKLYGKLNEIQNQISLSGNSIYASDAKEKIEPIVKEFIKNNFWELKNYSFEIDDNKGILVFHFTIFNRGPTSWDDVNFTDRKTFTGFKIKSTQNDILNQISAKFIEIQNQITLQGNLVFASEAKNSIETAIKSFFEKNNLQIKLFEIIDDDFNGSIKIDYQVSDGKIVAEGSIKFIGFKVKQNGEEIKDLISA